ncbi:MAG: hypothetical protein WA277_08975 [Nitrospirota bacterium]|jgi:hypothetical protein
MELNVSVEKDSISISIDNPFRLDLDSIMKRIEEFAASKGAGLDGMFINELIPGMIKGIAGCEAGCPSDAKRFVSQGFKNFELDYIEGGILTAKAATINGKTLSVKMFPDF